MAEYFQVGRLFACSATYDEYPYLSICMLATIVNVLFCCRFLNVYRSASYTGFNMLASDGETFV